MLLTAALLLASLQLPLPPEPDSPPGAYRDASARELVRGAREHRDRVDRSITAYRVTARESISAGVRALRRDRTLYQRDLAARILWRRDGTGRVELLGARQRAPMFVGGRRVPDGAGREASNLAFDPARQFLLQGIGDDDDNLLHPLAPGGERHYRFATGDTTRIRLADGSTVRLVQLRVTPRRSSGLLVRGSFWLEAESRAPVRGSFRLARPLDVVREVDDDDVPGWVPDVRMDLRYLTIEYGLWDGKWWLPRLVSLEGEMEASGIARVPVRFERSYTGYEVEGEGGPALALTAAEVEALRDTTAADSALVGPASGDSVRRGSISLGGPEGVTWRMERACDKGVCRRFRVEQPADSVLLGAGDEAVLAEEPLITEGELEELASLLGVVPPELWQRPELHWRYLQPGLLRYNRVEGLALGGRLEADFGAARADATVWLPTAQLEPVGEVGVERDRFASRYRLAGYRRLAAVQPDTRALGLGSSLSALLFGRDESVYYRTLGAELTREPLGTGAWTYRWRLFAERQSGAHKATDFSVPSLWDEGRVFRPNPAADLVDLAGASLAVRAQRGVDPAGWRWSGEVAATAATGTLSFLRPSVTTALGFPLPGPLVGAVEVAAGTALGNLPLQGQWFLGGTSTVRGYGADRLVGDSFWRGRVEVGHSFPAVRLAAFSDAGWAGSADDLILNPPLLSAGAGVGLLDGLLRLDLSRTLRALPGTEPAWRLDFYLDAIM